MWGRVGELTKEAERTYIQFVAQTGIIWRVRREILEIILGEQTETRMDPGQLRGMITFPPRFRGEAEKVRDKEEEGLLLFLEERGCTPNKKPNKTAEKGRRERNGCVVLGQ